MLHINDITFRMEGKLLLEEATAAVPPGHKVGIVGRNGTGKTTLFKLIQGQLSPEAGSIGMPRNAKVGGVAQEVPAGPTSLIDTVLAADKELTELTQEAETATDPNRIAEIQARLTDIGAHAAHARAGAILSGLGFDAEAQKRPCSDFSGGWRMRVALAGVLFAEPDVLLLDEPTNYLDIEGSIWLETYLKNYPYTVLFISHDRDLLNAVATGILHLEHRRLTYYTGNYDRFRRTRAEKLELQMAMRKKQEAARRHMESFVERFRYKASKARQAQSRLKMLEKMSVIAVAEDERAQPIRFPSPPSPLASPLVRLEEAQVGYEPDRPILRDINLRIDQDDRIALLGANGNGKSTFAKLLCDRLKVSGGHCYKSKKLKIAYFAQHQLDELRPSLTPYEHFAEMMPDGTQAQIRAMAGSYGFGADKADTKVEKLSGGEKARLLLAIATFEKPHMIILDEPTNHLDIEARESLMAAINEYEGAVILISHDRSLVEACADRLWLVANGSVASYDGDMEDYRRYLLDQSRKAGARPIAPSEDKPQASAPQTDKREARKLAAQMRETLNPLKKKVTEAERALDALQKDLAKLDEKLADTALYTDKPQEAERLMKRRGEILNGIEKAEEAWLEASETYEEAKAELETS